MIIINNLNGKNLFGINTELTGKGIIGTDLADRRRDCGYILTKNGVESYNLTDITEDNGQIILYNPELNFQIKPLFNEKNCMGTVKRLLEFYLKLKEIGVNVDSFSSNLFYKTEDDDLLMLPPFLVNFINARESLSKNIVDLSIYNHPDLKGERSILYSMGIIIYKNVTSDYPIVYRDVEDLRDKMRRNKLSKARWKNILISDSLEELLDSLLDTECNITVEETISKIDNVLETGLYRAEGDYSQEIKINAVKEQSMLNWEKRRAFFRLNLGKITIITLAAALFFSIAGSIIYNKLKPPTTSGFTSQQVLEAYFQSFQTLNTELLDETLKKGVRNSDSSELSAMYVSSKVRMQTDMMYRVKTPDEWIDADETAKKDLTVYGIKDLEITNIDENKYSVKYERWFMDTKESDEIIPETGVFKVVREEIFTLTETKYSYVITSIETLKDEIELVW